jgi:hypothetical protein
LSLASVTGDSQVVSFSESDKTDHCFKTGVHNSVICQAKIFLLVRGPKQKICSYILKNVSYGRKKVNNQDFELRGPHLSRVPYFVHACYKKYKMGWRQITDSF